MHEENYLNLFFIPQSYWPHYGSHISPFFVIGHVDFFGNLTGDSIAFIYPDLKHVLLGTFTKGKFFIMSTEFNKNISD